jgi:hypothetical protein
MWRWHGAAIIAALLASGAQTLAPARAAAEMLTIELNKLESFEDGCRSFFLFRNRTGVEWSVFELSLAILDRRGVIDRLLTIEAAPLPVGRTTLKLFEIPDIACESIGAVLMHDIAACEAEDGAFPDCFAVVDLTSLASAPLVK